MLRNLSTNTKFKSIVMGFFRRNKEEILDIILFGSSVREKEKPRDIDILVIYKIEKNIEKSYELKKELDREWNNVEIIDKTYSELVEGSFKAVEGILAEGYSLIYDKFLAGGFGYMNLHLFRYELKNLNKSERMRFYYSLYGRAESQSGMLKELNAIKFSDSILLCPVYSIERAKEYLKTWKINFIEFPILIPSRLKTII